MSDVFELSDLAVRLNTLRQQAEWVGLRQIARQRMEREFQQLAEGLMRGDGLDLEALAYKRGFWAGIKYLLDGPERTEKQVERALRKEEVGA